VQLLISEIRAALRIELLGGLRFVRGADSVTRFRTRKTAALLAYLAYHPHRSHSREVLTDLLWPDDEPEAGRHSLRTALSSLRRQLEPGGLGARVFVADHFSVGLAAAQVTTDVGEFEAAARSAQDASSPEERLRWLSRAAELYSGELLPGFYEEWIAPEHQRLEELYLRTLAALIKLLEERGDISSALEWARRAVHLDPLREETHRELIRLLGAAGQAGAALRQYAVLEQALRAELGAAPSPSTRALAERIRGEAAPAAPDEMTAPLHASAAARVCSLEPPGGAVRPGSTFYLQRDTDEEFIEALTRGDSIVLLKGARQVGKSSLVACGMQRAREAGRRTVLTSLQMLQSSQFESLECFLRTLADLLAEQLQLKVRPADVWDGRGANLNFWSYVREHVLGSSSEPLIWAVDDVDRLFTAPFGEEVFALFRSWHNERAFDPGGAWSRLTLAIGYATEAHLFVRDLNQSPFNVGTRLTLEDFTLAQVAELNRRYGSPLGDERQVGTFFGLVGGHPHLARCGLHEMAGRGATLPGLESRADSETGPFGDHLRRMHTLLGRDRELCDALAALLGGRPIPTAQAFYRLRSAGLILGDSPENARFRCGLYGRYLERRLS
jgi:DNA-binding SARP family transcriptional activator